MKISRAESVVMEVLWRDHPLGADEVINEIAESQNWSEATIKTLLNRLLKKHAVTAIRQGRKYLYSPALSRNDYVEEESQGLLDRLFEGRVSSLIMHFSQNEKLSASDIAELKQILREAEDE